MGNNYPSVDSGMPNRRRSSPPPEIPAAEDFGSRNRAAAANNRGGPRSRMPSIDSSAQQGGGIRAIAQPQPMGGPLAHISHHSSQQSLASSVAGGGAAPSQQPRQQPWASTPSSPQRNNTGALNNNSNAALNASPTSSPKGPGISTQRRPPPPPPPPSSRNAASSSPSKAAAPAAASLGLMSLFRPKQPSSAPPPAPISNALPEPETPPSPDQVALQTPAPEAAAPTPTIPSYPGGSRSAETAPALSDVGSDEEMHSLDGGDQDDEEHGMSTVAGSTTVGSTSAYNNKNLSKDSYNTTSDRRTGPAAGALGAAGIGSAAAATAAGRRSGSRTREQPAHTAYNMGSPSNDDSPWSEKGRLTSAGAAAATGGILGASAGSGSTPAWKITDKTANEGSRNRWNSTTPEDDNEAARGSSGAAGGGGGAATNGSLARSWRQHKKRWIFGIVFLLVIIIAAAVGGGVAGSSSSSSGGSTSASDRTSGGGSSSSGNGGTSTTGASGPSVTFTPDPDLHNSFYGMNYVPFDSNAPDCGVTIDDVIEDIERLSQLTTRLRLAGSACNETALVLDAIARTGVDLTIWPAIVLDDDTTLTSSDWVGQTDNITFALDAYGSANVGGVQIGDEFVTNIGSPSTLIQFVDAARALWDVPIGAADAASTWSTTMANGVDFIFANIQPWYSSIAADEAADWTYGQYTDLIVDSFTTTAKPSYISEVGWPSGAATTADATSGDAIASVSSLQTMLDTFVCSGNLNGTAYFWFEMYDDPNQRTTEAANAVGGVGGYWGLFDTNKNLKSGITLPNCPHA